MRRLLAKGRAKILFATISHHAGRWWLSLNVEAADLHPAHQHPPRDDGDQGGWVGVDRGLSAFVVAATAAGDQVACITAPKALAAGMKRQQRLAKALSRKQKGSRNRREGAARLGRHHHHVANVRRHFLHQVSNELVKTHDRLVIEDLNVWPTEYSPAVVDIPLTATTTRRSTSPAGANSTTSTPGPPSNGAGPPTPADGTALTSTPRVPVKPARKTREPTFTAHPRPEPKTPEKGGAEHSTDLFDTL